MRSPRQNQRRSHYQGSGPFQRSQRHGQGPRPGGYRDRDRSFHREGSGYQDRGRSHQGPTGGFSRDRGYGRPSFGQDSGSVRSGGGGSYHHQDARRQDGRRHPGSGSGYGHDRYRSRSEGNSFGQGSRSSYGRPYSQDRKFGDRRPFRRERDTFRRERDQKDGKFYYQDRRTERAPLARREHPRPHPFHRRGRHSPDARRFESRQSDRSAYQPDEAEKQFLSLTAVDPFPRIRLEDGSSELTMRALDLICPIGFGQRGLIVAPPGSGKTTFLKHICQSIAKSYPKIKLYCLLVDERPEEVTDFQRSVSAEVRSSSSDESYEHHIEVANELMKQAFREARSGEDVMILIDSLTRLSRVHNAEMRSGGRTLSGGVDARALEVPRRIFGSARKIENGGSLTILATILVHTGSRMDDVIFEEFKGTGNMEIVLSREISSQRIYPAVDIPKSNTRKEMLLVEPEELKKVHQVRRALAGMSAVEAARALINQLQKYPTNREMLDAIERQLQERKS